MPLCVLPCVLNVQTFLPENLHRKPMTNTTRGGTLRDKIVGFHDATRLATLILLSYLSLLLSLISLLSF